MDKLYSLGFDVGIASVGYAVLENDPETEKPCRILKLGVRTFSPNEVEKTGASTAQKTRELRGIHRRGHRKAFRFERMKKAIAKYLNINCDTDLKSLINTDIYEIRAKALDNKISDAELAKIILNLLKRRGFKSNRLNPSTSEDGKLLAAIKQNNLYLAEKGYRTIGEAIYKDDKYKTINCGKVIYNVRNHADDYKNSFARADLENELCLILNKQKEFGNLKIVDEFKDRVLEIFNNQRSFDEGPDPRQSKYSATYKIGNCTFCEGEKRAPKASFTFEFFSALSKLNSLRISGEEVSLAQKEEIIRLLKTREKVTFTNLRKLLAVPMTATFNLCHYSHRKNTPELSEEEFLKKCEDTTFISLKNSRQILKSLGLENFDGNEDLIDEIARVLSTCKSDEKITEEILNSELLHTLNEQQIENIKTLNFSQFGSLSLKAMKLIIPFLLQGQRYDQACESAGFSHSSFKYEKMKYLKGKIIEERLADVTSNVVKRAVNQTIRLLNEIIKIYGSPQFITIELSRDLSRTLSERKKIENKQKENYENNTKLIQEIKDTFGILDPRPLDLVKYKLYKEQDGKCMYSGRLIEIERLFEPNYTQIDHILPFSRSMNDSYNNKVLVLTSENQNKGKRTPYEWLGCDTAKWQGLVQRANLLNNREKKRFLLKEKFSAEEQKDFIERNSNDTRYMSKLLLEIFRDYLEMKPNKNYKHNVKSVNGYVTSYLRKCWGINKIRADGDLHHCVDAAVIATATTKQIQEITRFNYFKERFKKNPDGTFRNCETKQIMTQAEKDEFEKREREIYLEGRLPRPYDEFVDELKIRSKTNYLGQSFSLEDKNELRKLGYTEENIRIVKPVFVSRMKTVKYTGPIHEETMMSSREYKINKKLIKTVKISKLKVCDKEEPEKLKGDKYPNKSIENYYHPKDDRLLYLKLKEYIIENGGIPEGKEFYKPRSDGTDGPIVKSVKMYEKSSTFIETPHGAAKNDTMHRIDLFEKDGKFYICPIYIADVYRKKLPNEVIIPNKPWIKIDKTFKFLFSLYQNDLVKVRHKSKITLNKNITDKNTKEDDKISNNEFLLYYNGCGVTGGSISLLTNDRRYKIDSCGVKTLLSLEKYYVDIMGNVYKAPNEERKKL